MSDLTPDLTGLLKALLAIIDYSSGIPGPEVLHDSKTASSEGRFHCLVAKGGNITILNTTEMHTGDAFVDNIVLTPTEAPIYGDFKKVIIENTSPGQLLVYPRPEGI